MKMKLLNLFFLFILFNLSMMGQESISVVNVDNISHPFFKKISRYYYGRTSLPYFVGNTKSNKYMREKQSYEMCSYKKYVSIDLPLYAGFDNSLIESEQYILCLFYETNGTYFIGVTMAWSSDHNDYKYLIVTYDLRGNVIDYIPFYKSHVCSPNSVVSMEGVLNKNLTVDVYSLDFSNNIYPVTSSGKVVNNILGQRTDRHYKITPQGNFQLVTEVKYKSQNYAGSRLVSTQSIASGNEVKLSD